MSVFKADGVDGHNAPLAKTVTLWATATIAKNSVVMVDVTVTTYGYGYAVKTCNVPDSPLAVGVALESVTVTGTAYQRIKVQYAGPVGDTAVDPAYLASPVAQAATPPLVSSLVGSSSVTPGAIKIAAAPTASLLPFAMCVKTYTISDDDGVILIFDKGWYE